MKEEVKPNYFKRLNFDFKKDNLPQKFTFPFFYEPHSLAIFASEELQKYLETQTDFEHNFGLKSNQKGLVIGKMFGVLVVQNKDKEIGYLAAFSGKLGNSNQHSFFVPPIFDTLGKDNFFQQEEAVLNELNKCLAEHQTSIQLKEAISFLEDEYKLFQEEISTKKIFNKTQKSARKKKREEAENRLKGVELEAYLDHLKKQSIHESYELKHLTKDWKTRLAKAQEKLDIEQQPIKEIKLERKQKSNALQQKLFDQYHFLNIAGKSKNLQTIFQNTQALIPPAGAGECAAPKLLQYAFEHDLKPICMAEFWWGASPNLEVRKHKNYYPSCRSKCEPILGHMLAGLDLDENPMLINHALNKEIEIIYEDEAIVVINKPAEILSTPGKNIEDSVYTRMKAKYPEATGPLTVHRLDMSTTGIMLIAKTSRVHEHLQRQFLKRTIQKRYVALLEDVIEGNEGTIDLPLRVDLDNRPQQLVCYEHGKSAITYWKVIKIENGKTRIHFFPKTGRTHQLRVHAAHSKGLNTPIVGDDLYGTKKNRLHLHAEWIEFTHPNTKEKISFKIDAEF